MLTVTIIINRPKTAKLIEGISLQFYVTAFDCDFSYGSHSHCHKTVFIQTGK